MAQSMIVGWLAFGVLGVSPVVWPPVGHPVGELTVKVVNLMGEN